MVDYSTLRKVQLLEYELLKKFKEICDKEGIYYYLCGGTLLGAVKYKGFIPWDDDIDVALLRPDYDRFISIAGKYLEKGQALKHYSLDPSYRAYTMKLVNENVSFITQREYTTDKNNIWIDIFPLDGTPTNKMIRKLHFLKMDYLRMLLAFCYIDNLRIDENRGFVKRAVALLARKTHIGKAINPTKVKEKMDKELRKHNVKDAKFIGNHTTSNHGVSLFPISGMGEGKVVCFEDDCFRAPLKDDLFLRKKYGDYTKLPPENEQVPKHHIIDVQYNYLV